MQRGFKPRPQKPPTSPLSIGLRDEDGSTFFGEGGSEAAGGGARTRAFPSATSVLIMTLLKLFPLI